MVNIGVNILCLLALALFIALYVWSLVWVYRDAESRGKSGLLIALLVAVIWWPISLLVWKAYRPAYSVPDQTRDKTAMPD